MRSHNGSTDSWARRAPSKTDAERLLLVSPELAEVLTAIIFRVRRGQAAIPLVSAYDVFEQTWSAPMPFLFQRRYGSEDRALTRSYIRECLIATSAAAQITIIGEPLEWRPHDFHRIFVTDARSFVLTQLRSRGWKKSTPTSSTGSPRPNNRAGSAKSLELPRFGRHIRAFGYAAA
ncbi:hypothetical protein ACQPYK_50190 (plasmid) [Streptosporangium sp. CA-135522]|uniref:hypothetical protein n=1 Tax=Streptosporangium sp. CA-135522 TaxID=3240072 RepID=UPI003D940B15